MTDREERFYNAVALFGLCKLTPDEMMAVLLRRFNFMTLREIGREYGVTHQAIQLRHKEAVKKLFLFTLT